MIILRLFSRRDSFTDYWALPVSKEVRDNFSEDDILNPTIIIGNPSEEYNKNYKQLGFVDRNILKQLQKDIKAGHIYDDGVITASDTHFLADYSKRGSHLTFSKKISEEHRFNYIIHPIKINTGTNPETGEEIVYLVQEITYSSCWDHKLSGVGDYLDKNVKKLQEYKHRKKH